MKRFRFSASVVALCSLLLVGMTGCSGNEHDAAVGEGQFGEEQSLSVQEFASGTKSIIFSEIMSMQIDPSQLAGDFTNEDTVSVTGTVYYEGATDEDKGKSHSATVTLTYSGVEIDASTGAIVRAKLTVYNSEVFTNAYYLASYLAAFGLKVTDDPALMTDFLTMTYSTLECEIDYSQRYNASGVLTYGTAKLISENPDSRYLENLGGTRSSKVTIVSK